MWLYGAYGSNLHPQRLQQRIPNAKLKGKAEVSSWTIRFHKKGQDGSAKCNMVRSAHSSDKIFLAIYECSEEEKNQLDHIEGVGKGYEGHLVLIEGMGEIYCYVAHPDFVDEMVQPYSWYKDLVLQGCYYHQFPSNYIQAIQQVPSVKDPDSDRQLYHTQLVKSLSVSNQSRA